MNAWWIVWKDLLLLGRDHRALAILLFMPLMFVAILGLSTGKLFGEANGNALIRLAVVDADGSPTAVELVEALRRNRGLDVRMVDDPLTARRLVDDGARVAAVTIGSEFSARVEALELGDLIDLAGHRLAAGGAALDIEVYSRSSMIVIQAIVEQLVFGEAVRVVLPQVARRDPLIRGYLTSRTQPKPDPPGDDRPAEAPANYGNVVYQVLVPSYAVLFAFFLINIMARSFISERQSGTLQRIGMAPVSAVSIVLGKTAPFLLVSIAQGLLLLLFGKLVFGMSWGPTPWLLLPVVICTALAATALGLLTAVLVRTDAQVSAYANLLVIGLGGISGCFMPRQWLPELMRQVSLATPHAWSLIAYDQLLTSDQPDLARVWRSCGALLVFAAVFLAVGWRRFRATR